MSSDSRLDPDRFPLRHRPTQAGSARVESRRRSPFEGRPGFQGRPGFRGRGRRRGLIALGLSLTLVGSAVLSMSSATAAPKPTVKQAEAKVKKLRDQAEQASEDYNKTKVQLKSLKIRLQASQVQLARQDKELKAAQLSLGRLASETYRRGELSTLDLVLGDDPELALAQAGYLPTLSDRQAGATDRLRLGELKLAKTQSMIKSQQTKITSAQRKLGTTKKTINKKLAEATAELNKLTGTQRDTYNQDQNKSSGAGVPAGAGSAYCLEKADLATSAAARTALRFACGQLGKPYLWAADGPGSFDCSGLTMKSYAAAGVSLPHSSALQANYGTRVSVSDLQPGDLVFFHSPIHHVAIMLTSNLMVHAPQSGDVVRIASPYTTPVAAVRF